MAAIIQPVLMSGGSGLRLWPLSRQARPKQFAPLTGARSLFQETALRVAGQVDFDGGDGFDFLPPIVVASMAHESLIRAQLAEAGIAGARLLLEPIGRDTAPCAAAAASMVAADAPERLVLLLPCDHVINDPAAFRAALRTGALAAQAGRIVTFGAAPSAPDTAYGYIKAGAEEGEGVFSVAAFHEKPDRARAESYLAEGGYSWNAGIFLFRADTMLAEFARHAPDILETACAALDAAAAAGEGGLTLDPEAFAACRPRPLDRAVMEVTDRAAVIPVSMGWSDAGQWAAIRDLMEKDETGTAAAGDVIAVESRDCLARTDGPPVLLAGVEGLAVVVQDGMVLVTRLDAADSVKSLVQTLKETGRDDLL